MGIRCFGENEIAEVLELDPEDPRRRHLAACPRCRALALVFTEFMRDRTIPAGSDPADAGSRLQAAFAEAQSSGSPPRDLSGTRRAARPGPPWGRVFSWIPLTVRRPALAAAAVVLLVCSVYVTVGPHLRGERPDVLRGTRTALSPVTGSSAWLLPVEVDAAGHPVLRWRRVPGADAYEVRLFGDDLADFARLGPFADTLLVLLPETLPPAAASRSTAGWQVVALQAGLELAVSAPGTVQLR